MTTKTLYLEAYAESDFAEGLCYAVLKLTPEVLGCIWRLESIVHANGLNDAISEWANTALHANTQACSDGLSAFGALAEEIAEHHPVITGSGRAAAEHAEFRCVNIVLGNLKTAISGTYHAFNFAKYAPRYFAEFQYRFNRRYNLRSILPRLARAAAMTGPCTNRNKAG